MTSRYLRFRAEQVRTTPEAPVLRAATACSRSRMSQSQRSASVRGMLLAIFSMLACGWNCGGLVSETVSYARLEKSKRTHAVAFQVGHCKCGGEVFSYRCLPASCWSCYDPDVSVLWYGSSRSSNCRACGCGIRNWHRSWRGDMIRRHDWRLFVVKHAYSRWSVGGRKSLPRDSRVRYKKRVQSVYEMCRLKQQEQWLVNAKRKTKMTRLRVRCMDDAYLFDLRETGTLVARFLGLGFST